MMNMLPKNHVARILLATAGLLLIPLIAMQFSEDVDWRLSDFIIMGFLLMVTGLGIDWAATKNRTPKRRLVITALILAVFFLVWAELAVGLFGSPFAGS